MKRLILPLLALSFLLTGCQQHTGQPLPGQPSASLSKGQKLFLSHCVNCHQGFGNPPKPDAVVLDSSTLSEEAQFRALLRHPTSPMMQSFSPDVLSDAEVHEIYVYLTGFRAPDAG